MNSLIVSYIRLILRAVFLFLGGMGSHDFFSYHLLPNILLWSLYNLVRGSIKFVGKSFEIKSLKYRNSGNLW